MLWIRLQKDNKDAWNDFARDPYPDAPGSNAHMVSQQKLGLRAKWRTGTGRADYHYPASHGSHLSDRGMATFCSVSSLTELLMSHLRIHQRPDMKVMSSVTDLDRCRSAGIRYPDDGRAIDAVRWIPAKTPDAATQQATVKRSASAARRFNALETLLHR